MKTLYLLLLGISMVSSGSYHDYLNNYLHEFETLAKENVYLEHVTDFNIPTAMIFYVRIELQNKVFHASLQPNIGLFHPNLVVKHRQSDGYVDGSINIHEHLEGSLIDEPNSRVLIHIKDSIASGTIQTADGEKYFIEPSNRHIKEPHDFHMIAYKQSDVKFNFTGQPNGHFCGHDSHKGEADFLGKDLNDFIIPKNMDKPEGDSFQYSRKKRASSSKTRCTLALVADYLFYSEINAGEETNALNYMISLVSQIDPLYQAQSLDADESDDYKGYGFQISYLEVVTSPLTADADLDSYKYYVDGYSPDVSDLLGYFAYGDWEDYCLGHLFTNYDFDDGTLGLAYVASESTSSVGGVCTKTYSDGTGQQKNTNVGLSSSTNYGRTMLTSELVFVTGHEFGHNWGSSHDSDDSDDGCAPEDNYYMMYPSAVDGSESNNYLFSSCSKTAINKVLVSKADLCFVAEVTSYCGNGVVEDAEECDPGPDSSTCCTSGCLLAAGAECEDTNTECCSSCLYAGSDTVCLATNSDNDDSNHCVEDYTCNGAGTCAAGAAVDDGTTCYDDGSCSSGECLKFCEYRSKVACTCSDAEDSCKQCCQDTDDTTCEVYYDTAQDYKNLTDGKICGSGLCVSGTCEIGAQDVQEKFWELYDDIDVDMVSEWFKNNVVFAVIFFTSIFWIPISVFVDWLDDKYDLGLLDEVLGGDDKKKINQRGILLGSTKPADTATNIYPRVISNLAGTAI